ncbi:Alpha-N-acetylglucosaminidase [Coccomyxa sp. Obi]|nr:Alpha-N-acetylglucosaminidase [Coccomyxa sp. Obi]
MSTSLPITSRHAGVISDEYEAVRGLLQRVLPEYHHLFDLKILSNCNEVYPACFEVQAEGERITVKGSSGTEVAAGIHWFLKYACNSSISWHVTGGNNIDASCFQPDGLERVKEMGPLRGTRSVPWSYYQNVVTPSYSMAFWDWERWEQEIDWMALQGINLPLAFSGQEYIWQKVWAQFNISAADLEPFFAGPAFLAWQRMGNLRGYGGPLPQSYIDDQAELQHKIVRRMRSLGMTPVFPAFAGFVPEALARERPHARITRSDNWCAFPERYCCVHLLDPLEPLFQDIGSAFVKTLREEYGSDDVGFYSADTFNEMTPPSADPAYLMAVTRAIYNAMAAADPSAKWLMQAWLFYDNQEFWQPPQIEALVSGVPRDALILLDLYAEVSPLWKRTNSFYGAPFIYCMLHNFGGNIEMYGLVGIGMCPEGIEQNPVMYDLMSEWAFRRETVEVDGWIAAYARRRYGRETPPTALAAWDMLRRSVYNATDGHTDHSRDIPTSRPGLSPVEVGLWGLKPHLWYNEQQVVDAWGLLLHSVSELGSVEAFRYDLVDVGRQVISKRATDIWKAIAEAYVTGRSLVVRREGGRLLQLLDDLEELLATNRGFLLGPKLEEVRRAGHSGAEARLCEWNLRTQLTVWGTSDAGGSEIEDYANREWAGLISSYYKPRWALWLLRLETDLAQGRRYDPEAWRMESLNFALGWAYLQEQLPVHIQGETAAVSQRLYKIYGPGWRLGLNDLTLQPMEIDSV